MKEYVIFDIAIIDTQSVIEKKDELRPMKLSFVFLSHGPIAIKEIKSSHRHSRISEQIIPLLFRRDIDI